MSDEIERRNDGSIMVQEGEKGKQGVGNAFKRISYPLLVRTSSMPSSAPLTSE